MKWEFFCLLCHEVQPEGGEFQHSCPKEAVIPKRVPTRWARFCNWFWDLDHTFFLATCGGLAINAVFTHHFKYTPLESIIQGLGVGFLLGRIVRYGK